MLRTKRLQSNEDELLAMNYTDPEVMNEASRLVQHDRLHKQITVFHRLLQLVDERYSSVELNQMLQTLTRGIPIRKGPRIILQPTSTPILSLVELRRKVNMLENSRRKGILQQEENHLKEYFNSFFSLLTLLRNVHQNFVDKIHYCLMRYFYDPLDDTVGISHLSRQRTNSLNNLDRDYSANSLISRASLRSASQSDLRSNHAAYDQLPLAIQVDPQQTELYKIVYDLKQLCDSWYTILFREDTLEESQFSPETEKEALQFADHGAYDLLLRLMPEVLLKARKAITLAQEWWTKADQLYRTALPGTQTAREHRHNKIIHISDTVDELSRQVLESQRQLDQCRSALAATQERAKSFGRLSKRLEQYETTRDSLMMKRDTLRMRAGQLRHQLQRLQPSDDSARQYKSLETSLCRTERSMSFLDREIITWNSKVRETEEEFTVQLHDQPEIVVTASKQATEFTSLQLSARMREKQRDKLNRRLTLVRSNCDRVSHLLGDDPLIDFEEIEDIRMSRNKAIVAPTEKENSEEEEASETESESEPDETPTKSIFSKPRQYYSLPLSEVGRRQKASEERTDTTADGFFLTQHTFDETKENSPKSFSLASRKGDIRYHFTPQGITALHNTSVNAS